MAKEMFDKIIEEFGRIENILRASKTTGKIPEIERDIMLSKLRNIYEFLLLYQPDIIENKAIPPQKDEIKPDPIILTENAEPLHIKAEQIPPPEKKLIPTPEQGSVSKTKPEQHQEITPTSEKYEKPIIATAPSTILAEKFITKKSFLNEVLTQYANTYDIAKKFQNSPINDIFTAIGINDKFLFIRTLFNEDAELYQSTIEKLNHAGDFNEAIEYIDQNFTWDFESATVHKLLELIRRRHTMDRE
jgi:hypothetical protein